MAQRNLFPPSQMPMMDHDQIWSQPHPDSYLHSGSGSDSVMVPVDGATRSVALRPNEYPSSSFPSYVTRNGGALHDPYYPSSSASSSRFPPDQVFCTPHSTFTQPTGGMIDPGTEIGRAAFKRKTPAMPLPFNPGNTGGYYSTGSSSGLHISSNPPQPEPMAGPPCWPLDPAGIAHSYRSGNLPTASEDSIRNVRSRHNLLLHPRNPVAAYPSNNLPLHVHATGSLSGIGMEGQLSHVPVPTTSQGRNFLAGSSFSYEANRPLTGPAVVNNTIRTSGDILPHFSYNRNASSLPALRELPARSVGVDSNGYSHRSNPHRSSSSYTPVGYTANLEAGGGLSGMESLASPRYSRQLPVAAHSSYRSGRTRPSYSRFQSNYDEDGARSRWLAEAAEMMEHANFYDSRNWFDQHRDMRLDVDNMSYEELVALGERIGNVSTGLSEEALSGSLQEIAHCSAYQTGDDQEEVKCAICLEEYDDQDKLGRLTCGHDFHLSCIKQWLLIKNSCPVCKAAARRDSPKAKQA